MFSSKQLIAPNSFLSSYYMTTKDTNTYVSVFHLDIHEGIYFLIGMMSSWKKLQSIVVLKKSLNEENNFLSSIYKMLYNFKTDWFFEMIIIMASKKYSFQDFFLNLNYKCFLNIILKTALFLLHPVKLLKQEEYCILKNWVVIPNYSSLNYSITRHLIFKDPGYPRDSNSFK